MKTIITNTLKAGTIKIKKGESLTYIAILNKGWKKTKKLNFDFEGENSSITFMALVIGKGENKFQFETISNHKAQNTKSNYIIRSVLSEKSEIDYKGNLVIKEKAQQTKAYLSHHSLMLSDTAKVNTIPSLEIEADEVKAGHSASIGKIDEDMLFYLKSRGINKKDSENLLIESFLKKDLKEIKDEKNRSKVEIALDKILK